MRYRWALVACLPLAASVLSGCGASNEPENGANSHATAASRDNTGGTLEPPAQAIAQFLDAVRRGDDQGATAMFTPLARQKANEIGLAVAPKGSDTASFQVGQVQYLSKTAAQVDSTWSDLGEDGQPHADAIQWLVQQSAEGWRVAGMTAVVFPGEPPLQLNFENPKEMLQKLETLRAEMARRNPPETVQATRPAVSQDSFQR